MRDAIRYRQKRICGKSGDSGDEASIDESTQDSDMANALAFLTPTASKFPRQTTTLGGSSGIPTTSFTKTRTPPETMTDEDLLKIPADFEDETSSSTVYSYVCICVMKYFTV